MATALPYRNLNNKRNNNCPRVIKLFFLLILLLVLFESRLNNSNTETINIKNSDENSNVEKFLNIEPSNKVGIKMNESLNEIENILKNVNETTTSKQIDEYIINVRNCNLSTEYNPYKEKVIQKLMYYKQFIETKNNKYIKLYNDINVLTELAKVFDEIGIKYTWINGSLQYNYEMK